MKMKSNQKAIALIVAGTVMVLVGAFVLPSPAVGKWVVGVGAIVGLASLYFLRAKTAAPAGTLAAEREKLQQEREEFERWQKAQAAVFQTQSSRIEERNRDLLERSARFQELAEYPACDHKALVEHSTSAQFSAQDQQVNLLLEREAERVYEKIRKNDYTVNGVVDLSTIRGEVLDLIQRVARIYSPNSANPLLETSFEQLARSVSRICLHSLVLLEQLPLDVKRYTINELHGYLRKAIQGYGAYQQVAPWLKHLSRSAYAGRIVAGANPVTLGAWWLASEIGRRGTQKMVENVVDRQAVAALHDFITIIGTEVANVYGPGYRQRDAAWVYGSELAELVSRFPISRDSLVHALRELTALPLRSEYDRIYLYRCIANHRAAGLRLADSAGLTRAAREDIAKRLEHFYRNHVHGQTPEVRSEWQNDVESRLDLKLHFGEPGEVSTAHSDERAEAALRSVHAFLVSTLELKPDVAADLAGASDLMPSVALPRRRPLLQELAEARSDVRFEPPDLDPSAEITKTFLQSLMSCVIRSEKSDPHVEELLIETACYFRRTRDESETLLHECFRQELKLRIVDSYDLPQLDGLMARSILAELLDDEEVVAIFDGVSLKQAGTLHRDDSLALVVIQHAHDVHQRRAALVSAEPDGSGIWASTSSIAITRDKGLFIDDCVISGGEWRRSDVHVADAITLSGSISGGGYKRFFDPVLSLVK